MERPASNAAGPGVLAAAAREAPVTPGVYLFLDDHREVLYVGKAQDLRQRLGQHAAVRTRRSRLDRKYDLVRRVVWETAFDEQAALWREADLIFALHPPFNADPGLRDHDPLGGRALASYLVVEEASLLLRFRLDPDPATSGRAYGCFPHLGKGVSSDLGIACSDGYTALLRLLWAASGQGSHTPAAITRSAPGRFTVSASDDTRALLPGFLSGTSLRLADHLLRGASLRPAFMQPALRRDAEAALTFFAAGPRLVRDRRRRHGVRRRILDAETYARLVREEIRPVISGYS